MQRMSCQHHFTQNKPKYEYNGFHILRYPGNLHLNDDNLRSENDQGKNSYKYLSTL